MSTFNVKQGDLVPAITATLMQAVGTAAATVIDLTAASSVKFAMRNRQLGTNKVDAAGTIVSAAAGTVKYQWVGTDTDTEGVFDCEWQITWPTGKQTVPGSGYDQIVIGDDIAT
jgi:hypothetical protein